MRCMFGLESSPAQTLWWLTILANSYPPLERFINAFCHWSTNFDGLEGRQLWLNLCHRSSAHKDGSLWISQGHHWRPKPCWDHHWRGSKALRPLRLNCHRPGVTIHLKVLVIAILFPRHQTKTLHRFPPPDGWADQKAE